MQTQFPQQIARHFPDQRAFLIGLSGGVDSVVLLHLLCQLRQTQPLQLRAVHIHHGLSPNAEAWVHFCQQLCQEWQVPLVVRRVKVCGDQGVEGNARAARYHAIGEIIQPDEIFTTAHHLDDQAETFFLALKRGAGVKGLSAMQAVKFWQNFVLFRPLLPFSKSDILHYAQANNLAWVEDESNHNQGFDRNFLRYAVLPALNQRWQGFNQMVARAGQHCAEQQMLLEELLAEELSQRINLTEKSLDITGFGDFSRLKQQQLLRLWLEKCQQPMPSQAQLEQIRQRLILAGQDKNPQFQLGEQRIRRYQDRIFITPPLEAIGEVAFSLPPHQKTEILLPATLGVLKRHGAEILLENSQKFARLSLPEALKNEPLTVKFQPPSQLKCYGKPHREEMKKIWQLHKIPPWQRGRTPLLFWGEELVTVLQNG